ncbi:NAD-dependent epimerase/dehydratase family protein [Halobacillus rhizosphaerae]|uniref:NAD-dependent epimerase/dehydratase family protein n=1 Tax=Halobacillus rhizosphaerae TaxID=3064889 RepID=UPI00398B1B8B
MQLLIIGGTQFVGKSIVEHAIARDHQVTLFNRGRTNPSLFKSVEQIKGDRENIEDLSQLKGRKWDAVIDTCGFTPQVVAQSAELLKDQVHLYCYISTMSVYKHLTEQDHLTESAEVMTLTEGELQKVTNGMEGRGSNEYYGPLKFHSERAVTDIMSESRSLLIRPGLIVGPDDPTDRFTYWPVRVKAGGEFIVPEPKEKKVQFIDVRDLSAWILHMIENHETGVYHAAGPEQKLTMHNFIQSCQAVLNLEAEPRWVTESFLLKEQVQPWMEVPLWVPTEGNFGIDCTKAIEKGLKFRAIEKTIKDTSAWYEARENKELKAGLSFQKESSLLQKINDASVEEPDV